MSYITQYWVRVLSNVITNWLKRYIISLLKCPFFWPSNYFSISLKFYIELKNLSIECPETLQVSICRWFLISGDFVRLFIDLNWQSEMKQISTSCRITVYVNYNFLKFKFWSHMTLKAAVSVTWFWKSKFSDISETILKRVKWSKFVILVHVVVEGNL